MLSSEDIETLTAAQSTISSYAVVKNNIFSEEGFEDRIFNDVQVLLRSDKLRLARMSRGEDIWSDDYFRGDSLCWVTPELIKEMNLTSLGGFMKRVMEGVEPLKHYLGLQDDCTMQFAVYPGKGEGYNRHKDAFPIPVEKERSDAYASNCNDGSSSNTRPIGRQLTCLCYLNKDWEPEDGGQLRVFTPTGAFIEGGGNLFNFWGCNGFDIEPLFGRLVIFRSEIVEHAVLPCHRERMALTLWITGSGPSSSERGTLQGEEKEMGLFSFASNTVDDTGSDDDTSSAEDRSVRIEETDNNNSNSNSNNVGDGDIAVEK